MPKWFEKPKWFLMYTVLFSVVAGLVQAGALPSIITTLQKRFGFSSTLMGFVLALMDAVMVVIAIPVGHYGSRGNKARLTAIGFCTINVSLILFALPHFVTPKYEPDINGASDRIECNPGGSNNDCPVIHKSSSWVIVFFIIGQLLFATSYSPLISLASTYLQENVEKYSLALYLAWMQVGLVIGPAIGFIVTGMMLSIWVNVGEAPPAGLTETNPAWIGAWWLPIVISAGIGVATSWTGLAFPKHLPGTEHIRQQLSASQDVDASASPRYGADDDGIPKTESQQPLSGALATAHHTSLWQSLKAVATNKPTLCVTIAAICDSLIVSAFAAFLPKVFEAQFSLKPSIASIITGAIVVPGAAGGALFGGWVIKRWKMDVPAMAKTSALFAGISSVLLFSLFLNCPTQSVVGVNTQYDVGVVKLPSLVTACNADCACGIHRQFEPVCGSDHKSYFSVCHAGCLDVTGGSYGNCSCIPDGVSTATEGICKQSCVAFPIACVCFGLGMFFVFSSHAPALNIVMRVLPPEHVSMGLSAMQAVWKLFGSFPGPILLGSIFDSHCLYDRTACDGAKSCALYDNKPLSVSYALLGVFPKMIATASYLLALWFYRQSKAHMDTQRLVASRSDGAVMVDGLVSDYSPMGVDDAAGASPLTSEHVSVELSTIRAPPPGDDDTLQSPILSH